MWVRCNPNPGHYYVEDCVVRAIAIATNHTWLEVYDDICLEGRMMYNMPSINRVWGHYLYRTGWAPFILPEACPECITIREFAKRFRKGTYIIGTGMHAVAVIDGDYYDAWDSGDEVPSYFFVKRTYR